MCLFKMKLLFSLTKIYYFFQVKAATYALARHCSVVICNGCEENAIVNIVKGKKVGTFFTNAVHRGTPVELQAKLGKLCLCINFGNKICYDLGQNLCLCKE